MNKLTVDECIQQFRMYAKSNANAPEKQHSLNFCADFLQKFCKDVSQQDQSTRPDNDANKAFDDRVGAAVRDLRKDI